MNGRPVLDDDDLRRLALSCLLLGFVGPVPPRWLLDALAEGLGGVVLFGSNLPDGAAPARLTAALRSAAARDIVVAIDEEGGDVTRLDAWHGSAAPGAAALGYLDDPAATEAVYRGIGARCAAAGVTLNLAPVADVNVDPGNPVIGVRAFSADGQVAARHVSAAVRGIQAAGVAACLKHFPGHGATHTDSHHEVATVDRSRAQLEAAELMPFRAGVAAGARAVMTGHLLVPALDPTAVATVSPAITTDLLRMDLGFGGTVVTDALEMRAISATIGMVDGFVQALQGGADTVETGALDYPALVAEIPAAVSRALAEGRLAVARLADAARRTAALATPASVLSTPNVEFDAAGCVEVVGRLPVLRAPLVIECRPPAGMAAGWLPWSIAAPLAQLIPGTDVKETTAGCELDPARDVVLVVRDPQRVAWQQPMIAAAREHPRAVVVDCGWPSEIADVPLIRTRGIAPGLLRAAAHTLAAGGADSP
ncbi:MAG TPA: glycoside hydrolase family 3 N-terminal domain-containing protein [Jatrophihabitans sp.]|nr:glycoside hydrolase family 3 N-terminal domain-containing protein [Jatrophihabitans sp.]